MKKTVQTAVVSFTGYSGSGKTTFIEKLIPVLKNRGLKIGIIKHDAHSFQIDKEGKDSFRYRASGADVVGIFSRDQMAVYGSSEVLLPEGYEALSQADINRLTDEDGSDYVQKTSGAVNEMLNLMPYNLDLIIIEGARGSSLPKIGISRLGTGKGLSLDASQLVAVITDDPAVKHDNKFGLDDVNDVADFITSKLPYSMKKSVTICQDDYPRGITADEAIRILDSVHLTRKTEQVSIYDALGRIISEDIKALQDFPPFRRSPLDGYAFHSSDTKGADKDNPAVLKVVAEIPAGSHFDGALPKGCAVRLMTGAPVPDGADAIEKYESTEFTADEVKLFCEFKPDTNIVPRGEDYKAGDILIPANTRLDPFCISVLAMLGKVKANVYKKPSVALISTGTELVPVDTVTLGEGQIRSSSVYTIGGIAESEGARAIDMGIVSDETDAITSSILKAASFADIIVTTGGVSAGDYDLVVDALKNAGAEILFHKVKMKPGMAFAAAVLDKSIILALSGNPSAAAVSMDVFGRGVIRKMSGSSSIGIDTVKVRLRTPMKKKSPMGRYIRGRLVFEKGMAYLDPSPVSANGVTSANCQMNMLGIVPPGGGTAADDLIDAYYFD